MLDSTTRREYLVRRFLDGLRHEEVRWEVEYVKEPENIDEAVYYKISNIQPRSMRMTYGEKRKKIVRSTKSEVETEVPRMAMTLMKMNGEFQ